MSTIQTNSYLISAGEYDKYYQRLAAFMSAVVTDRAKKNGSASDFFDRTGEYWLRSAAANSSNEVLFVDRNSNRSKGGRSDTSWFGVRAALNLIYDPESRIVKDVKKKTCTNLLYVSTINDHIQEKYITSTASIVTYGGKEYIWVNREECERGEEKTMLLWMLCIEDCAVPFDSEKSHNDYAKAEELRAQVNNLVFENCTKEEKAMAVPVEMNSADGYESLIFIDLYDKKRKKLKKETTEKIKTAKTEEELNKIKADYDKKMLDIVVGKMQYDFKVKEIKETWKNIEKTKVLEEKKYKSYLFISGYENEIDISKIDKDYFEILDEFSEEFNVLRKTALQECEEATEIKQLDKIEKELCCGYEKIINEVINKINKIKKLKGLSEFSGD